MFRGTPVISAGFQAKISKFCLSKEHSSLRPCFLLSDAKQLSVPGTPVNFYIYFLFRYYGEAALRIFLMPGLPIIALCWDDDLMTMKFIQAEVECASSPIFTSKAIWPSGQMVSPLNPTSFAVLDHFTIAFIRLHASSCYSPYRMKFAVLARLPFFHRSYHWVELELSFFQCENSLRFRQSAGNFPLVENTVVILYISSKDLGILSYRRLINPGCVNDRFIDETLARS
ncbi:hypothetical protein Tco_1218694 [Tanacetum coccineum]